MGYLSGYDDAMGQVLEDIRQERFKQLKKWGVQAHPDGTGLPGDAQRADQARLICEDADGRKALTWRHISDEETSEAYAETDPVLLRKELVQQAAVLVAWVEDIDQRFEASRKKKERVP